MLRNERRSECLQALRASAAVSVAAMHCFLNNGGLQPKADPALHIITRLLASFAGAGVDLFFVLSGFLIYGITAKPRGHNVGSAIQFVIRRAARIYPLYWVTMCFFVALITLRGFSLPPLSSLEWLRVISLTSRDVPLQDPAWTLAYEVWFYIGMTGILLLPVRWFKRSIIIWTSLQILALHFRIPGYMFSAPQVLEFFMGCAVAEIVVTPFPLRGYANLKFILCIAAAIFVIGSVICYHNLAGAQSLSGWQRVVYYGAPSALSVYALLRLESAALVKAPKWLSYLGDCSYSIYLLHYPVMAFLFVFQPTAYQSMSSIGKALTALTITILLSFCSYKFIEKPGIALGKWLVSGGKINVHSDIAR